MLHTFGWKKIGALHQAGHAGLFSRVSDFTGSIKCSSRLSLKAVPEIIHGGGMGRRHFFVLCGGGCLVDTVSEGWGVGVEGVTCPGGQGVFDP